MKKFHAVFRYNKVQERFCFVGITLIIPGTIPEDEREIYQELLPGQKLTEFIIGK